MEAPESRHLDQPYDQLSRGYDTYQPDARYSQVAANQTELYLSLSTSQAIGAGQRNYPYNHGQQPQYPSDPHIQDIPRQYDIGSPQIDQRQSQYPAYSSDLMYNTTALAQSTQTPIEFDSVQGYRLGRATAIIDSLTGNQFEVPQQSYNALSDPSSAQFSNLSDYSNAQYQHQNQLPYQQIPGVHSSDPSIQPHLTGTYHPTTEDEYQFPLNMPNAPGPDCMAPTVCEDSNYQTCKEVLTSVYQAIQRGHLSEAGRDLSTFTSGWFGDNLELFGKFGGYHFSMMHDAGQK